MFRIKFLLIDQFMTQDRKCKFNRRLFVFLILNHFRCRSVKYLKYLPSTSVIVTVFNEWQSILLRTIHSIYNRTPHNLLKELIIVNDNSSKPELGEQLELYLKSNFDSRVKLLRLKQRKGLIVARMEGAKMATGEVLVFLDSHMEVNS